MKSVMKNYGLSSLISDAISSPVGSTQRKRASALLKSLRTMRENNNYKNGRVAMIDMANMGMEDGKGGSGTALPTPYNVPQTGVNAPSISSLSPEQAQQVPNMGPVNVSGSYSFDALQGILGSIPQLQGMNVSTPMVTSGWTPPKTTPQVTPVVNQPSGTTSPALTKLNVGSKTAFDLFNSPSINQDFLLSPAEAKPQYVEITPAWNNGQSVDAPMVLNKSTNKLEPRYEYKNGIWVDKIAPSGVTTILPGTALRPSFTPQPVQPQEQAQQKSVTAPSPVTEKTLTPEQSRVEAEKRAMEYGQTNVWQTPTDVAAGQQVDLDANTPPEIKNWAQNWYSNLDASDQKKFETLFNAVNSGLGASSFAYMVMSDRDELHKLFPNVPLEDLPMGASLARQVVDLKGRVKQELGLNELENKMNQIQSRGYTILPTLTDYVRGRDEYLGEIDNMIEDTKTKITSMDLSDPTLNKSMSDYMNYLYVLKGRQNKRYGDWIQQSIDTHNAEVNSINDQYKIVSQRYQDEVASQAAITQEDYNNWKTTLTEMYNSIDGAENKQLETQTLKAQLQKTYLDMAIDAVGAKGNKLDQSYLGDKDKYFDIIGGVKQNAVGPIGSDGKPTNIYSERAMDIDQMMNQAEAAGLDPEGVVYWLANSYFPSYVKDEISKGNINEPIDFYGNMIKNFANSSSRTNTLQDASTLINTLITSFDSGLDNYLKNENVKGNIKDVLDDLTSTKWFSGKQKYDSSTSRDEFLENNKGRLPDDVLNKIFDTYEVNVLEAGANPKDLYDTSQPDDNLVDQVKRNVSSSVRASLFSSQ
jgi:hypothetical protein